MAILRKSEVFASKPRTKTVEVAEWGGEVVVKATTIRDTLRFTDLLFARAREIEDYEVDQKLPEEERRGVEKVEPYDDTLLQIACSLVNEDGSPLIDLETDYEQLLDLSYSSINLLYAAVVELRRPPLPALSTVKKTLK